MAYEPILILDPDPVSRSQLTDILTSSGYDVYGVTAADRLVDAVKASPFPAVMIDVWIPNIDRVALLNAIREASPNTAVIVMGEKQVFAWLVEVFRAGAADFIPKPFDPIEVRERVDRALAKRQTRLKELQAIQQGMGPVAQPVLQRLDDDTRGLVEEFLAFQEQSLEVFLELERRNISLEKQVAALEDPGGGEYNRALRLLVGHPDERVGQSLQSLRDELKLRFPGQALTGGEVLDRLGALSVDLVVIGPDLPDIPGEIVISNIAGQYPQLEIIKLEDWGTSDCCAIILDADGNETESVPVESSAELVNLVRERCTKYRDREEAKKFAQMFRKRHQEYIRALANIKSRIEKVLGASSR